jgi:hypothetical protein
LAGECVNSKLIRESFTLGENSCLQFCKKVPGKNFKSNRIKGSLKQFCKKVPGRNFQSNRIKGSLKQFCKKAPGKPCLITPLIETVLKI